MNISLWFQVAFFSVTIYGNNAESYIDSGIPIQSLTSITRDEFNRDGKLPKFPIVPDLRRKSVNVGKAHEVLRKGLQEFLDYSDADLGTYLNHMINQSEPYVDEYGQVIRLYKKVFTFISEQHAEILLHNYAIGQFEKDKLDLCSAARFLSHQKPVLDRATIMKRMGDALGYKCHPCTLYRRKQYGETVVPDTENIGPEGVSPEESFIMCNPDQSQSSPLRMTNTSATTGKQILQIIEVAQQEKISETTTELSTDSLFITQDLQSDYGSCRYSYLKKCMSINHCDWFFQGEVVCDNVAINEIEDIFHRTSRITFDSIKLVFRQTENHLIPANILANKRAKHLLLDFGQPLSNKTVSWVVDPNSFQSTKNFTKIVEMYGIDCSLWDFGFLSGFNQLKNLTICSCFHTQFCLPSLPPLPSLTILDLSHITGLAEIETFPYLANGLQFASFIPYEADDDEMWNDATVNNLVDWILLSSSDSLEFLTLKDNKYMTEVPHQIPFFTSLKYLNMANNRIHAVSRGALSFHAPLNFLNLNHNKIRSIQPGAFQGDFTNAQINMAENLMTRFDESVFGEILQQMDFGLGLIETRGNGFKCDTANICRLSWLFKDGYKHMVGDKIFGRCSNETGFIQLQPEAFGHCPTSRKSNITGKEKLLQHASTRLFYLSSSGSTFPTPYTIIHFNHYPLFLVLLTFVLS